MLLCLSECQGRRPLGTYAGPGQHNAATAPHHTSLQPLDHRFKVVDVSSAAREGQTHASIWYCSYCIQREPSIVGQEGKTADMNIFKHVAPLSGYKKDISNQTETDLKDVSPCMAPQGPARLHSRENGTHLVVSGPRNQQHQKPYRRGSRGSAVRQCPSIGPLEPGGQQRSGPFGHLRHTAAKREPPPLVKPQNIPKVAARAQTRSVR